MLRSGPNLWSKKTIYNLFDWTCFTYVCRNDPPAVGKSLYNFFCECVSLSECLFLCRHFNFPTPLFVWPVKLLKTQRAKARQAGWADCKAGWGWRSVHGCKRFSRNQASKTPGLGSVERKALWTPGQRKRYTLINIFFVFLGLWHLQCFIYKS